MVLVRAEKYIQVHLRPKGWNVFGWSAQLETTQAVHKLTPATGA